MPPIPFQPSPIPGLEAMMADINIQGGINGRGNRHGAPDPTSKAFFDHSTAPRINTDAVIVTALQKQYPHLQLLDIPQYSCDLVSYAVAGHATLVPITDNDDYNSIPPSLRPPGIPATQDNIGEQASLSSSSATPSHLTWTSYIPPSRRLDHSPGYLVNEVKFGRFYLTWQSHSFILYYALTSDSTYPPSNPQQYLLFAPSTPSSSLLLSAGTWQSSLHDEVLVFDSGRWTKSSSLWSSIRHSSWDSVIMDDAMKKAIIGDHLSFFTSQKKYKELGVPWKRGLIYHGPPGNGKTISIKATMNMLSRLREDAQGDKKGGIPTLYVRTLASFMGPEYSIQQIFTKARQFAPCYLVFEDLDSIVSDEVRSYFLNEVDGLKANDGIFMVGSTNHLERLDPGISKRPSRFDRKYYFPDPDLEQRKAYCRFWQGKLKRGDNGSVVDFPDKLCGAIAGITGGFSFAYIQEAFVAALLAIARQESSSSCLEEEIVMVPTAENRGGADDWVDVMGGGGGDDDDDGDKELEKYVLWREIKKQIEILREGMDDGGGDDDDKTGGASF